MESTRVRPHETIFNHRLLLWLAMRPYTIEQGPDRMEDIDIDEIAEVSYSGEDASIVDVTFKDGTTKRFNGAEHQEIFALLNHWSPPTA